MKILFFDLETTGVKFWENGIHQISGIICVDGEIKQDFNFKVKPFDNKKIEEQALKVGEVTLEQILAYPNPQEIYKELIKILGNYVDKYDTKDKFFLAGYNNASFDNQFLREFFTDNGDKYFGSWFWSNSLDIMVLASEFLKERRAFLPNFKLHTVAMELALDFDKQKLHDAAYDIELTKSIYDKITI